jgi:hypothetical protein
MMQGSTGSGGAAARSAERSSVLLSGTQTVRAGKEASLKSLVESQLENNADSRSYWDAFADHRKRVMALLHKKSPLDRARICILGAVAN